MFVGRGEQHQALIRNLGCFLERGEKGKLNDKRDRMRTVFGSQSVRNLLVSVSPPG